MLNSYLNAGQGTNTTHTHTHTHTRMHTNIYIIKLVRLPANKRLPETLFVYLELTTHRRQTNNSNIPEDISDISNVYMPLIPTGQTRVEFDNPY